MTQTAWWVAGVNIVLSIGVLWLAYRLLRWCVQLRALTRWLDEAAVVHKTQAAGYELTYRRFQLVQAKLGLAQVQLRSRQLRQLWQLLRWMRLLQILTRYTATHPSRQSSRLGSRLGKSSRHKQQSSSQEQRNVR